jgi:amidophosphoribosyltransferase
MFMGETGHNCGLCVTHSLHDCYNFLKSLRNRGREANGIAAVGDDGIDVIKWAGPTERFELDTLYELLDGSSPVFMGHVRYATKGRKELDQILSDAHPIALDGDVSKRGGHIIIRNARIAGVHNGQVDDSHFEDLEVEKFYTGTDTEKLLNLYDQIKEKELLKRVPGAYTIAIADSGIKDVVVMRDKTGIKPGVIGWKDGKYVVASEDYALFDNGAEFRGELEPGCVYYMSKDGRSFNPIKIVEEEPKRCFFEWNYIAHHGSTLDDVKVEILRRKLGEKIAEEFQDQINFDDVDFITHVPKCPKGAAIALSKVTGIKYLPVFYKENSERSFMGSDSESRKKSIRNNLHLIDRIEDKIRGKKIVVIDDSTIRGTNGRAAARLLNHFAWVDKADLINYTPEIGIVPNDGIPRGCKFGVDMPPEESPPDHVFIARGNSLEQISKQVGMDVRYLSLDSMLEVFEDLGIPRGNLCTYCVGGPHPFDKDSTVTQLTFEESS